MGNGNHGGTQQRATGRLCRRAFIVSYAVLQLYYIRWLYNTITIITVIIQTSRKLNKG